MVTSGEVYGSSPKAVVEPSVICGTLKLALTIHRAQKELPNSLEYSAHQLHTKRKQTVRRMS